MERRYQMIEKLALALVIATWHLRPYFQSHQVVVKTDYPIKQILRKPKLAGQMIACHVTLEQSLKFGFKVTNNQAEYEALLARLRLAHDLGAWRRYFHLATQQISSFEEFTIHHVPREQNARADLLSKLASTKCPEQHWTIIQETLHSPSLDDKVVNTSDSGDQGWMTGIWNYLKEGALPEDKDEAWKMRVRSAKFFIVRDELFKRGISTPLLKCLAKPQATYVVEEIHRGICGMHSRARSMVTSVLQAGYYWPTMKSDCQAYVQKCKECQQFGNAHRQPLEALHQMMSLWPFAQWRMDILGPFPLRKGSTQIPHHGNRLLHQVDRGMPTRQDHHRERTEVHLEEHYMQVWYSTFLGH
uniref:Gypsy retrotransposon integrase-like protein 1 n=1 Tax=Cajanus cajan TaxID=3821 RepID=A0A151QMV7_CAJCA|nr:hypothetical protein KK1_048002 [Cajanus cajan]